jgi:adenylate kinase
LSKGADRTINVGARKERSDPMTRIYVLCGQSGVGKSTVLSKVDEGDRGIAVVNFGQRILNVAKNHGLASNPEEVQGLSPEDLAKLQLEASEEIAEMGGRIVIDMHLTVRTPVGFIAGMPRKVADTLKPARIILLEEDPYEVLKRRMTGKDMKNVDESLKEIQEHMDFDRAAAISVAIDIGASVKIVRNDDIDKAMAKIWEILDEDALA